MYTLFDFKKLENGFQFILNDYLLEDMKNDLQAKPIEPIVYEISKYLSKYNNYILSITPIHVDISDKDEPNIEIDSSLYSTMPKDELNTITQYIYEIINVLFDVMERNALENV